MTYIIFFVHHLKIISQFSPKKQFNFFFTLKNVIITKCADWVIYRIVQTKKSSSSGDPCALVTGHGGLNT